MGIERRDRGANRAGFGGIALVLGLLLVVGSPVRAASWYEHYENADRAMRAGEWEQAAELLQAALAQKGESGTRVRTYGMNFIPYFPYLKLGIARHHLADYDAALLAFEAEERLGAIRQSTADLAELERYRRLSTEGRASVESARRELAVSEILSEARALEERGDLDSAVAALSRADALDPKNAAVTDALARLRTGIARLQRERDLDERVESLVTRGRALLREEKYSDAAAVLARANSLRPNDATGALLGRAQAELAAELQAQQDVAVRRRTIADELDRALKLEQTGNTEVALDALRTVLALDPRNRQAADSQRRLLAAQARADVTASLEERVRSMLRETAEQAQAGDLVASLVTANRVLAIDPDNGDAYRFIASAYRALARQHTDPGQLAKVPPIVRILPDLRETQLDDGRMAEWVSSPEFRLGGDVLAMSVGRLRVFDQHDTLVHETGWAQPRAEGEATEGSFSRMDFGVRHALSPGLTAFRIEASIDDGMTVSREYLVYYDRPLVRDWRLYLALAGVAAGVGALLYGRRRRRRTRLQTRRFNPYIAGAPVLKDDLFFGRERLLERVLQTLHNNSILLYGERRIGKTSLQHQLRKRLKQLRDPDYDFHPVFTDLQGVPQEKFFATLAEDVFEQLGPVLDGLSPHPSLHDGDDYGYPQFVRDMRNVLKHIKSKSEKGVKVVLLIDEVDALNDYDPRINQKLRALFMRSFAEDLVAVVSGVGIKKRWESEGSPWYNFFEEIRVEPFRREDAEELIRRPVQGIFTLAPDAVTRIIDLADCRPYPIQKLCIALVDRMHAEKRRRITVADVEAVSPSKEA